MVVLFKNEFFCVCMFGFMCDVECFWVVGLVFGFFFENFVVILDNDMVVNLEGLCYKGDEFVCYKMLDVVGDFVLVGVQFIGCYCFYCGGYKMNVLVFKVLLQDFLVYEVVEVFVSCQCVCVFEMIVVNVLEFVFWSV